MLENDYLAKTIITEKESQPNKFKEIEKLMTEVNKKKKKEIDEEVKKAPNDIGEDIESIDFSDLLPYIVNIDKMPTKIKYKLSSHKGECNCLVYDPIGLKIASGDSLGIVKIWNPEEGKEKCTIKATNKPITSLSISIDGNLLVVGSIENNVKCFNISTEKLVNIFSGHTGI
jgi:WD40 repeat protein